METTEKFAPEPQGTSLSIVEATTRGEVDIQIATAHKYPRNIAQAKQDMISMATADIQTALACFYSIPRGGKQIKGKNIRLAEIALACYGNLRAATRIKSEVANGPHPYVTVEAAVHDLEKNNAVCIEKRRIITKKKAADCVDDDDISLAVGQCSAIAIRDAIFKVIPNAITNQVYDAAVKVAIGDAKSLSDRWNMACEYFGKLGKYEKDLLQRCGKKDKKDITLDDIELLLGLWSAIKEGETTIEAAFEHDKPEQATVKLGDLIPGKLADHRNVAEANAPEKKRGRPAKTEAKKSDPADMPPCEDWLWLQQGAALEGDAIKQAMAEMGVMTLDGLQVASPLCAELRKRVTKIVNAKESIGYPKYQDNAEATKQ